VSGMPTSAARPRAAARVRRGVGDAASALAFLTVLPVRTRGDAANVGAASGWFPLVGALVGGLAGAARYATEPLFGATIASILALAVLVGLTGALHQDGLADCADGLGVLGDRERRLAVMRDPATGVFGTLALLGWALLLVAALARLDDEAALRAVVVAAVAARAAALLHATTTAPARRDGLGAAFDPPRSALVFAAATTLAAATLVLGPAKGLGAIAAAALVAVTMSAWARGALGGRTGDSIGATVALAEVAVCLTLVALAGA
jgi:adenosylcobinamide-GDP ribazoletransferase